MRNAPVLTPPRRLTGRADVYCATAGAVLVAAAFLYPRILSEPARGRLYAGAAPIFGNWLPHIGWGTAPAIGVAALVISYGPTLARQLPWRRALALTWLTAIAWAFALAMVDGWQRGFAGRLTTRDEYLHEVGGVHDIAAMLRGFSGRILDFQPNSWTTHVSGHPPGALLSFVLLDRIGLGGGAWAATLCLLVGTSAVVAIPVAIRALGSADLDDGAGVARHGAATGDQPRWFSRFAGSSGAAPEFTDIAEQRARAALPFLALAPAAIWIAVSADALFAGVTAWAVALLAIATRGQRHWVATGLAAGLLFGFGIFLSYGLVLMAVAAAFVLAARTFRPAIPALIGVLLVVAAFKAAGFWWLDGYHLVVQRYYQGIASERPYSYWVWANLGGTVCALGLAPVAALARVARGIAPNMPGPASAADSAAQLAPAAVAPAHPDAGSAFDGEAAVSDREGVVALSAPHDGGGMNPGGPAARYSALLNAVRNWRGAVDPAALVAAAGLAALLLADLSGLSKAETERIWLPFTVWVIAGAGLLPARWGRVWLGVQAVGALVLVHFILTNW
ncbi:hypothetical protein [Nocardia sp. NPDC056000]|uniref:hypothetical protein n=1 Tax=Nocardia sp. NPDC056000 TaxID=3345674 RepID=UPI0035E0B45B